MIGSLLARYATKAMLNAAKKAVPRLIAHKVASTIVAAATKKRKK